MLPPCFPDLNPMFYLGLHLKNQVYVDRPEKAAKGKCGMLQKSLKIQLMQNIANTKQFEKLSFETY